MTDINRKIRRGSALYKALRNYMVSNDVTCVGLSVPSTHPSTYVKGVAEKFWMRFPEAYVDEVDSLLAQGRSRCALNINVKLGTADVIRVKSENVYNSVLLSLFVQSVQQLNPTSRVLYSMVNVKPMHGVGVFVSCETNQCCFRYLAAKLHPSTTTDDSGQSDVRLYVREHVKHDSLLDLRVITKWMNCEYQAPF